MGSGLIYQTPTPFFFLMAGYYKQPGLTRQTIINGWIYSGDLGYMDEDGYPCSFRVPSFQNDSNLSQVSFQADGCRRAYPDKLKEFFLDMF